jgi:predicted DNA-binding protein
LAESHVSTDRTFPSKSVRWDDNNKRVTFYCPLELVQQLENLPKGRSKSAFIVEAITAAFSREDASM